MFHALVDVGFAGISMTAKKDAALDVRQRLFQALGRKVDHW